MDESKKEENATEYRIARSMPMPATTVTPYAIALSRCNTLAAISLQGIHVYDTTANVTVRESFHLEHRLIPTPTETNAAQESEIARAVVNKDIWVSEIHDVFLDRTISPARTSDEPYSTAFRQVCWSPLGLLDDKRCLLTGLTADHRVTLYGNGRWAWQELDRPSDHWAQHLQSRRWADVCEDENHSEVFSKLKNRSYMLGTIAIDWSPLYDSSESKWAWLICLQRSGHLVIWRAAAPFKNVQLETFFDLQIHLPATFKVCQRPNSNDLLVLTGTHQGLVKCHQLSWGDDVHSLKIDSLGHVSDADGMSVSAVEMLSINTRCEVIICAKNNFVLFYSVRIDPSSDTATGNVQVLDQRHTSFQGLNISSLCLLDNGKIVCATEDYQLHEIEVRVDPESGTFTDGSTGLSVRPITIPNNPVMLCRGLAVSRQPAAMAIFALESLKVPHDHLQCRQPSNIVVYVTENLQGVLETIKSITCMKTALVALESYKALCGCNSDLIWEPEVEEWKCQSVPQLQLVRWFALFKSHASSDLDTKEELKTRAQIAEFWLRLKYLEASFRVFLNRDEPLNDEQRLTIHLAHEFVTVTSLVFSNELGNRIAYDRTLIDQLRKKYLTEPTPEEPCGICGSGVAFENMNVGKCPNGHQAVRCFATLRLCFDRTLRCRWCGAHYRMEAVFEAINDCILCGGPTRIN